MKEFFPRHIEVKLRAYQNGQYFRIHADAVAGRKVTYTFYLFPHDRPFTGGDLLVFDTSMDGLSHSRDFTRLIPKSNTLYCFPSYFYHAVTEVNAPSQNLRSSRLTINGHIDEEVITN
ncbi:MAG: 2OG-Fe(II) oxygenase [Nitrospinae bacterium]|nr:2OG-Fe(II) oxygenase [Nitrospinota bacterium]